MDAFEVQEKTDRSVSAYHDILGCESGFYFASNEFEHCLVSFNSQGQLLARFGVFGQGPDQLRYPCGLEKIGTRLLVADSWNHRIQVFDLYGNHIRSFGSLGTGACQFQVPLDIKLGPDGLLYILDSENNRLLLVDSETYETVALYDGGGFHDVSKQQFEPGGLVLSHPFQLLIHEHIVYVLEATRIIRLEGYLVNILKFERPYSRQRMLAASASEVICFEADRYAVNGFCFNEGRQTASHQVDTAAVKLFVGSGKLIALDRDHQTHVVATMASLLGADTKIRKVATQTEAGLQDGQIATPQDSMECFERGLQACDARLEHFHSVYLGLGPECLRADSEGISIADLASHGRLKKAVLSLKGRKQSDRLETCIQGYEREHLSTVSYLRRRCVSQNGDQRGKLWLSYIVRCIAHFGKLARWRLEAIECLATQPFASLKSELSAVHSLSVHFFYLERLTRVGFKILEQLKVLLRWFDRDELFASRHIEGQFVLNIPEDFVSFNDYVLNYLIKLRPECAGIPTHPSLAFARAKWAIERTVLYDTYLKLRNARETDKYLYTSYVTLANILQLYQYKGLLNYAYGYHFNLLEYLVFSYKTGGDPCALLDALRNSEFFVLPCVQHDLGCYLMLSPDPGPSIVAFQAAIAGFEEAGAKQNSLYVSAVVNAATTMAISGDLEKAIDTLSKIHGTTEYTKTCGNLLASTGDFNGALKTVQIESTLYWPLQFTQGMIYLYVADWESAINLFKNRVQSFPEHIARLCVGISLRTAHRFEEALICFNKLEQEGLPTLSYQKGLLFRMMGKDQEAMALFSKQSETLPFQFNALQELITRRKLCQPMGPKHASLDDVYLLSGGRRVTGNDPAFFDVADAQLEIEKYALDPNADTQIKLAHYEWLEPLISQSLFFLNKKVRHLSGEGG